MRLITGILSKKMAAFAVVLMTTALVLALPTGVYADCCSCENSFGESRAVCLSDNAWQLLHGECADGSNPKIEQNICSINNQPCDAENNKCETGNCIERATCDDSTSPPKCPLSCSRSNKDNANTCIKACGMTTNSCCICNGTGTFVCAKSTDPNVYTTEESCPSTYNEDKRAGGRGCTTAADCTGNCTYLARPGNKPFINILNPGSVSDLFKDINPLGGANICDGGNLTVGCIISLVVNTIVFPLSGIFLFLMIVWGGYQMVNGSLMGSQNTIQRGQQRIRGAFLGFLMLAAVFWLWALIEAITGIKVVGN